MIGQRLALVLSFATLLAVAGISTLLDFKSRRDAAMVAHTLTVLQKATDLRLRLYRTESAARGYGISGEPSYITIYEREIANLPGAIDGLIASVGDNPQQIALIESSRSAIERRLAVSTELIRLRGASDMDGINRMVAKAPARNAMSEISARLDQFTEEENRLLAERSAQSGLTGAVLLAVDVAGVALVMGLGLLLIRRSREQLQHSSAVIENTFNSMAEGVLVIQPNGNIVICNKAAERFLGVRAGKTFADMLVESTFFHADGVTAVADDDRPIAATLRGRSIDRAEVVVKPTDGRPTIRLMVSGRPLYDASGVITGAAMVYHDVTDAHETERLLQQAQKLDAIGQLTGGVAHDFNNMLTVITGSADVLVNVVRDNPIATEIAGLISRASDRCTELIRHLLAFARKQPLHPRDVDVNSTVVDTVKLLRPTLGEQIEIDSVLEEETLVAHVDSAQLANSLVNLAINARDAMPNGGKLLLETRRAVLDEAYATANPGVVPGAYIMVAVSDTGTGMPPEVRDRAFEPFFTTKEASKGSGLGLSMVYGFAKQSGGHVNIYSEGGRGTTIRLYMPPAAAGATPETASDQTVPHGTETILVVEDESLVREFVTSQLQALGYRTITAATGAEALAVVKSGQFFDLVFTDVIMPGGMNGKELAEAIMPLRPGMKMLYTSGYTDNAIIEHGRLDAGALLLTKPYRRSELANMIRAALGDTAEIELTSPG